MKTWCWRGKDSKDGIDWGAVSLIGERWHWQRKEWHIQGVADWRCSETDASVFWNWLSSH